MKRMNQSPLVVLLLVGIGCRGQDVGSSSADTGVAIEGKCAPTQGNIFPNPGLDRSATGWMSGDTKQIGDWDALVDATNCAASGSLKTLGLVISDLLPVQAGATHHFGFLVSREQAVTAKNPCTIRWCRTEACSLPDGVVGWDEVYARPAKAGTTWEESSSTYLPPPGIVGARVVCGDSPGAEHFDRFYWSTTVESF